MKRKRFSKPFIWLTTAVGAVVCALSVHNLPFGKLDFRFVLLAAVTIIISSRISIQIPRTNTNITVADTFIFMTMLLYGGEAAVIVAAAEGFSSGLRISKTPRIVSFAFAATAVSTFITTQVVELFFGPTTQLLDSDFSHAFFALSVIALVQYFANTVIVAIGISLKDNQPIWQTWSTYCNWVSITYLAGAAAAGTVTAISDKAGVYAVMGAMPVIFVIYLTYNKYLNDIKASAKKSELAERARAEAEYARAESERKRAELAEEHVEAQNKHIQELEQIKNDLEDSREHFRHAAFHDSLTGLPNRSLLTDQLKLSIERARHSGEHMFSVLFLDLDRFKNINDSLGHAAGDSLLIEMAARLESCLRPSDAIARLGGDEFAILLDGLRSREEAVRVAERIQEEVARPFSLGASEVYTTTSIGINICSGYYDNPEDILRDADTAMYHAKENGKARYELFDTRMHANAVAKLQLENDLRRALENDEFIVAYQPIVSLKSGRIAGFETLVRWHHPIRGLVGPNDFVPLAEETGLIVDIDTYVLKESCRQMREWVLESVEEPSLTVSVNLSSKHFVGQDLIRRVRQALNDSGLESKYLKLEITESAVMDCAETAASLLKQLRELGIQLSIDDFGTGYSSLSYLHRFPVNTLKIDRSFVTRMAKGENTEIVRTIVTLARNLGMTVVAEGVETYEQHHLLREMNCEYGQGYFFCKPVDAAKASNLLAQANGLAANSHTHLLQSMEHQIPATADELAA